MMMPALTAAPTPGIDSLTDALLRAEPEHALEQAFKKLSGGCEWPFLVAVVKALVRVNLAGIAVRLLRSILAGNPQLSPQITLLIGELERLPSGEVSPTLTQKRYAANRSLLIRRYPRLDAMLPIDVPSGVRIFASAKGNLHAVREVSGGGLNFVFPFADHVAQVAALKLPPLKNSSGTFVLNGVPSVALWNRLLALRSDSGYIPSIDLIEPDPEVLRIWLVMIDANDAFDDERVSPFIGSDAIEQYREFVARHDWRLSGLYCLTSSRPGWKPPVIDQQFNESVAAAAKMRRAAISAEICQRYAGRDAAYWRRRFHEALNGGPPLQVIGFTSRYSTVMQHAMRDLAAAFIRKGCQFEAVMQASCHEPTVDVGAVLRQRDVDLVVVINHMRSEFAETIPGNVPYVCWIQDYMEQLWDARASGSIGPLELILGHSPWIMTGVFGYPAQRFLATSNLTDPFTYAAEPVATADRRPHECDVSFVSHGSEPVEQMISRMGASSPAFIRLLSEFAALVQRELDSKAGISLGRRLAIMLEAERASGHPLISPQTRCTKVFPAVSCVYDRIVRHQTLEWAARWAERGNRRMRMYGRGWEKHSRFARFACGEIENGYALRCVYQASAVAIQANGYSSLHPRLLDGLACGCLMLSRYNPNDWHRVALSAVQRIILEHEVRDLAELSSLAQNDESVAAIIADAEERIGLRLADASEPQRRRDIAMLRDAGMAKSPFADDATWFEAVRTLGPMPNRVAGEIEGFDRLTFRSETELHMMLNEFVAAPERRNVVVAKARNSVVRYDTYDVLVGRILNHFGATAAHSSTAVRDVEVMR